MYPFLELEQENNEIDCAIPRIFQTSNKPIAVLTASSPKECQEKCQEKKACKNWNLHPGKVNNCQLFKKFKMSAHGVFQLTVKSSGGLSGPKNCPQSNSFSTLSWHGTYKIQPFQSLAARASM